MKLALYLIPGALFGLGLVISGMANPAKVIAFLDLSGRWDPSLLFVMVGAIGVFALLNQLVHRAAAPALGGTLPGPRSRGALDGRLFAGAALFGVGWGLSGICPGPALVGLGTGRVEVLSFVAAMLVGMAGAQRVFGLDAPPASCAAATCAPAHEQQQEPEQELARSA